MIYVLLYYDCFALQTCSFTWFAGSLLGESSRVIIDIVIVMVMLCQVLCNRFVFLLFLIWFYITRVFRFRVFAHNTIPVKNYVSLNYHSRDKTSSQKKIESMARNADQDILSYSPRCTSARQILP